MKMDGKGGMGRSRKISPKIIFLILKGNNFFRHTLHFGKVVASKSKLKLPWTGLVHLTIFLAYTPKIRPINIVRKDLECRKIRTSYLLASSSLAYFQAFYIQRNRNLP